MLISGYPDGWISKQARKQNLMTRLRNSTPYCNTGDSKWGNWKGSHTDGDDA